MRLIVLTVICLLLLFALPTFVTACDHPSAFAACAPAGTVTYGNVVLAPVGYAPARVIVRAPRDVVTYPAPLGFVEQRTIERRGLFGRRVRSETTRFFR